MKKTFKQQLIASGIALSLLGGGFYLGTPDVSAASTSSNEVKPRGGIHHSQGLAQPFSDSLLTLLKLNKATLETKLESGKSLAQIATEQGVTREALKAELTKQASQVLDKHKSEYTANLDTVIDSTQLGKPSKQSHSDKGHRNKPSKGIGKALDLAPIAKLLGYEKLSDLQTALQSASSISELATAKKVDIQKIKDEITKQLQTGLDKRLEDGSLTQVKFNELKADLPMKAMDILNKKNKK
jgi:hypothetical protein